ncbi:MAG: hypothetical protein A4E27_00649 [Methanobacterium sp. PtaU1.Bin242]|nr:MAG: hypothetical protein A4E27_00649 [Methanobacterium sp. PtaU1.Bin242]
MVGKNYRKGKCCGSCEHAYFSVNWGLRCFDMCPGKSEGVDEEMVCDNWKPEI